ncbi:GntR family transcriptional regulator [Microbacterium sp.]|uniref:GntR family transcriptional regulator n=1 Tax=Microbacterium sp. TaxID=51671 RepID=UPI001ACF72D1|nr:GntR family transcriptional regulator [Microbacterium sp.]MBN9156112.1 GntR family transcriptional regulator [Microbacterium sp.]MBS1900988.1 GntR family transcriptional regulator [Actinomycetota bacterium]
MESGPEAEHAAIALADRVYRDVLRSIIEGETAPGAWLKERELSERFEVSRIPVRQALQRLEAEGFVIASRHRGANVTPLTRADVHDLFDTRLCFEPFAAQRAAERVRDGSESIDRLDELHEAASVADPQVARAASIDFHSEVVRLSGSRLLLRSLGPLAGRMEWVFRLTREARDREQTDEHVDLVEAIAHGRGSLAAALMYAHIEMSREPVLAQLDGVLDG